MFIKPMPGRVIPDPEHGDVLPIAGRQVERSQYFLRRLADGDVIETDPPLEPEPIKPALVDEAMPEAEETAAE